MPTRPDYSLSVDYRLPRRGIWVQVWFAGDDERWAYARLIGDTWMVDSGELPNEVPISWRIITHWLEAPPRPQPINRSGFMDSAADVILDPEPPRAIQKPPKQLSK